MENNENNCDNLFIFFFGHLNAKHLLVHCKWNIFGFGVFVKEKKKKHVKSNGNLKKTTKQTVYKQLYLRGCACI